MGNNATLSVSTFSGYGRLCVLQFQSLIKDLTLIFACCFNWVLQLCFSQLKGASDSILLLTLLEASPSFGSSHNPSYISVNNKFIKFSSATPTEHAMCPESLNDTLPKLFQYAGSVEQY